MPDPSGGKKTALRGVIAGAQDLASRFRGVFGLSSIFGPGEPLVPPEPERVRTWQYPVGYNFTYTPRAWEPIGFDELRALAENHDITRLAIETRKDQIEALTWSIRSREPNNPKADAAPRIEKLTEFWNHPDGDRPFGTWLRIALEDLLVIDAPCFEIRRNRGGEVIGLDNVDGATIKVLVDETGRRPKPPAPAYEQVIHGRPWRLLTTDELLYMPRNPRPWKAYGFSPVEQITMTVNIALRRQVMQLQHFTEGNVPAGLLNAPDDWSAEQIRQFQEWFDSVLAGNTAQRTRLVWGPNGAKYQAFKEPPHKDDFDEWLARIVCFAFSLAPNAFIRHVQRTTADTLQEAALKEGLWPLQGWVKRFADTVIQRLFGHSDLEFSWNEEEALDPQGQAKMLVELVQEGIWTRNEARAQQGLDPVEGGDEVMVDTTNGPVLLREARAQPAPAQD